MVRVHGGVVYSFPQRGGTIVFEPTPFATMGAYSVTSTDTFMVLYMVMYSIAQNVSETVLQPFCISFCRIVYAAVATVESLSALYNVVAMVSIFTVGILSISF